MISYHWEKTRLEEAQTDRRSYRNVTMSTVLRLFGWSSRAPLVERSFDSSRSIQPDKALANVSELINLKVLVIVAGEGGNITDDGLEHLKKLTKLELLNLMATSVTDEGLDHIKQMKNLKTLWLSATAMTADGAAELQQALPKLRIMR